MTEIFKIRSTTTGLYSNGGMSPKFTKIGKVWRTIGHVHSHLSQLGKFWKNNYELNQCEIVTFECQEVITSTISIKEYLFNKEQQLLIAKQRK